jgi:hypothetical protein
MVAAVEGDDMRRFIEMMSVMLRIVCEGRRWAAAVVVSRSTPRSSN